jgi:hypothetical protein
VPYRTWLLVLVLAAPLLASCATSGTAQPPFVLTSIVPIEGYDRTDMQCYYGVVW